MSKPYIHKKTGGSYFVTGEAINATNANDGQVMIIYTKDHQIFFVREKSEFYEKFEEDGLRERFA